MLFEQVPHWWDNFEQFLDWASVPPGELRLGGHDLPQPLARRQRFCIPEHQSIGRAPDGRFLLRCFTALILHLAAVEAHGRVEGVQQVNHELARC